jgi:hypothetical protein
MSQDIQRIGMKLGIAKKCSANMPAFADGGTVQPFTVRGIMNRAKGLFESDPPETMTQKYARQDAERAAKTQVPATPSTPTTSEKPDVIDTIKARNKMMQGLADGGMVKQLRYLAGMPNNEQPMEKSRPAPTMNNQAPVENKPITSKLTVDDLGRGLGLENVRRHKAKMDAQGLKEGGAVKAGIIRGPGTGTSDSIKGTMRPGSFVMPKDSTDVMVSNGETNFTPEMVQSIGAAALMAAKDLTHTPVDEQDAAKFANGGEVEEEKKPMSYGEQMRNVGSAIVNAPIEVAKTIVSAPGYGFNKEPVAPIPVPSAAVQPAAPNLGIAPSAAGAGRGFINPTLANPNTPTPASPLTKVDLGNGITKTTGGSSPLFSNVGDADNAALLGRGKVSAQNQLAINGIQTRQDTADAATQNRLQYQSEVNDATTFREGQVQAGIQRRALNGNRNALSLLQGQTADATARRGQDIQAAGQAATNQNAAARLGIDRTSAGLQNQQTTQQIGASKQMQDLQTRLLTAKPEERAAIEDNLRALQGKYEKPVADRFTVVPGGTDEMGNKQASRVLNNQTGQFVDAPQAKPAFEAGKIYTDAKGNRATWNGTAFVPAK